MTPYFSVIIPVYNRENFVQPTIDSVLNQKFENFEIIVVDDCSTDKSVEVINRNTDPRVKLIQQDTNQERGAARNRGFEESKGKYVCFLDSDDFFEPNHLETFYQHIQNKNEPVALLFSNTLMDNGEKRWKKEVPLLEDHNVFEYILRYTFNPARTCIHREVIAEFKFDPTIPGLEDLDLWLHIATKYPLIQLHEYTNIYNLHEEQYTFGDPKRHEKELNNFKKVFSKEILKDKLPNKEKKRLLAQCYYYLSLKHKSFPKIFSNSFKSYLLYPKGYNKNSNKAMFVNSVYSVPVFGPITKKIVRKLK